MTNFTHPQFQSKPKLISSIYTDISKDEMRQFLVKKQWTILEYPFPIQRFTYSKKDSFEMLSYLYDENKIRLAQLGYQLTKLGEYEKGCYTLVINDLEIKYDDQIMFSEKKILHQWNMLYQLITVSESTHKIKIPNECLSTINPLHPFNKERLNDIGLHLEGEIDDLWLINNESK
jgi:hypothetical protein